MFLNFKRSSAKYIILFILTLGIYNFVFKREVADDTNRVFGEKVLDKPGAKYFFLNIVTIGIYGILWDMKVLALYQDYLEKNGSERKIDFESYKFLGMIPFARAADVPVFINTLNEVCKIYSDAQLADIDDDDGYLAVNRVRDVKEEDLYVPEKTDAHTDVAEKIEEKSEEKNDIGRTKLKPDGESHKIAGYSVVEEYDPEKDQKRIAYQFRLEREARAAAKLAENQPVAEEETKPEEPVDETPIRCYRSKRWFVKVFASLFAVFFIPFLFIAVTVFALPPVYDDTFVGVLGDKYDRLNEFDEPKVVIVGGSSVAFGIDSDLIWQELGMQVVNFGLYADLGTKMMMDLSKTNINEGDIIVLAPEMNSQTLSLYFNGDTALQALDGHPDMLMRIASEDYGSLIGASFKFTCEKIGYLISGDRPQNDGAYKKENFNGFGDNIYDRPYNVMNGVQNVITLDFNAKMNDSRVTEYEEYISYVNEYVHYAERKGAMVYFSFCPMNEAAMSSDNTEKSINSFYENLCSVLECKVISNVYDYILDEGYFYDSEFHLNNAGVTVRTVRLIDDIKRQLGDTSVTMSETELPPPPGYAPVDTEEGEEGAENFLFEEYKVGDDTYYRVIGLSEAGKLLEELTVPNNYNGIPVRSIGADAFKDCTNLKTLIIGDNIASIEAYAFNGAVSLTSVILPDDKKAVDISVPNNMAGALATDGCNPGLKIYVNKEHIEGYRSDYFWGDYNQFLAEKQ